MDIPISIIRGDMHQGHEHIRKPGSESGFTLVELLLVIIIIAIIAAIAIPVYLLQREKAWDSIVESDLHNAALSQNTYYIDNGSYSGSLDDLLDVGFEQSENVTLSIESATNEYYCIEGLNANNPDRIWWVESGAGSPYPQVGECP